MIATLMQVVVVQNTNTSKSENYSDQGLEACEVKV